MCGIAGILSLAGEPVSEASALAMARSLRHRGPDLMASYGDPGGRCALGHSRLSVIDLVSGDQPMGSANGTVQVVFNGEIYNFRKVRRELELEGFSFTTQSDTEVILHGYERWGPTVVEHLDGMFAFAIWDGRSGQLLLARDRTGKKPLFIYQDDRQLAFASEMKAFRALDSVDLSLAAEAFPLYLAYGYVPAPRTFHRRVRKLPPATVALVDSKGRVEERKYWSLRFHGEGTSRATAITGVQVALEAAVERRLVSDVPLGAFLSGGIDSTLIVGCMSRLTSSPVRTFSIAFSDDPLYDESHFARLVAKRFNTEHTEFQVRADSVELLDRLVGTYDEPFGDSSAIPTYLVSELTRKHVTVALSGDGGDELFAGYPRFLGFDLAERTPGWVTKAGHWIARRLPHSDNFRSPVRRAQRFMAAAALGPEERLLRWIGFMTHQGDAALRPSFRDLVSKEVLLESLRVPREAAAGGTPLDQVLTMNFHTYLPEDLLVKVDRCSMAHGLEIRSPFLDTELIEFAAGLPDRFRIRRGTLKVLLKEAFPDLLPKEIRSRGKMGFGIPLPRWLRESWRPRVEALLLSPDACYRHWIEPGPVEAVVGEHFRRVADHGHVIWALLTLETWLRSIPEGQP